MTNETVNTDKPASPHSLQFPRDSGIREKLKRLCTLLEAKQKKEMGFTARMPMYTAAQIAIDDLINDLEQNSN